MQPDVLHRRLLVITLAFAMTALANAVSADRVMPLDGTVLIRVIGHLRVLRGEDERVWRERLMDLQEVEVAIGSGFIISPEGWVVTNHHVVSGDKSTVLVQGQKLEVSVQVTGIEVLMPADRTRQQAPQRFTATIYADDPQLDIALLRVNGNGLPYLALGDSDAAVSGDDVTAVGFPYGELLEIDKPSVAEGAPVPTLTAGNVSALRNDQSGEPRYLQVSAALNPGNSGGPISDEEGYVIGVAQSRVERATGIGFAVPINRVKQLLQKHGLDAILPVTLHSSLSAMALPAKGLTVHIPAGFEDRSPLRLRVEAVTTGNRTSRVGEGTDDYLTLRIDRIATTQPLEQLERGLLSDAVFERFQSGGLFQQSRVHTANGRRVLSGHASGADPETDAPLKLVYTLVDLGREKLVARYVGAADAIAANRSLLQTSLANLAATPLLTAEVSRIQQPSWDASLRSAGNGVTIATVAGWVTETGQPWACAAGLIPAPSAALVMSPSGDFTVGLRASWHPGATNAAAAAARKCSPQPGAFGETSYAARADAWGIAYQVDGVFVAVPERGVWQLEMVAPLDKSRFVAGLFGEWVKSLSR
jgi:hypothetical protein